jgi:hypothetical protein
MRLNMDTLIRTALITLCLTHVAAAQDADLRSGKLRPRTGIVSEEVARQKLLTFGLTDVQNLRLEGARWYASGVLESQRIEVELDVFTGLARIPGRTEPLQASGVSAAPMMRNYSIKVERAEIQHVPVVVEAFVPDRPSVIRPLGDRPVLERPPVMRHESTKPPPQ